MLEKLWPALCIQARQINAKTIPSKLCSTPQLYASGKLLEPGLVQSTGEGIFNYHRISIRNYGTWYVLCFIFSIAANVCTCICTSADSRKHFQHGAEALC